MSYTSLAIFLLVRTNLLYCWLERSVESGICIFWGRISIVRSLAFFLLQMELDTRCSPTLAWMIHGAVFTESYVALLVKCLLEVVNKKKHEWSQCVDTKAYYSTDMDVTHTETICD